MAISTENRNDYIGNGATPVYPYTFKIFAETDLQVTTRDTAGGETRLSWPADFSVSGVGADAGGSVTLTAGNLTSDWGLTITRVRPYSQETALRNQRSFFADVHEDTFDHITMLSQQLKVLTDRAIKVQESLALAGYSLVLPPPEANKALGWDPTGKIITNLSTGVVTPLAMDAPNVTFLQGGAGAVVRSLRDRLREDVSVKDFDAIGDGGTDDWDAFHLALAYAASIGSSVKVPAGTYLVSKPVVVPDGVTLYGFGWDCIILGSDVHMPPIPETGSASAVVYVAANASGVTIRDLYVKGQYTAGTGDYTFGIYLGTNTVNCQVLNCKVTDSAWSGIHLKGTGHLVQGNRTETNAIDGIESWASHTRIIGNHSFNDAAGLNPLGGASIEILPGATHVQIIGNVSESSNLVGIVISSGGPAQSMILIDSNTIKNCGARGIVDNAGTADLTIVNNLVDSPLGSGALGYGIYLANSTRFKVAHNTVIGANVGAGPAGIQIDGTCDGGTVNDNTAYNNWVGLVITGATGTNETVHVMNNHSYGNLSGVDYVNNSSGTKVFDSVNAFGHNTLTSKLPSLICPIITGGAAVDSELVLKGTSGNGTAAAPAVEIKVGNDGGTLATRWCNNGNIVIGDPNCALLETFGIVNKTLGVRSSSATDAIIYVTNSNGAGRTWSVRSKNDGNYYVYNDGAGSYSLAVTPVNLVAIKAFAAATGNHVCYDTTTVAGMNTLADCTSLRALKQDFSDLPTALDKVAALTPQAYTEKNTGRRRFGFVAEDTQAVHPQLSTYKGDGSLIGVDFDAITALLVKAVQELSEKVK